MVLGERKQKILGAVVRDYVDTIRPVGSEELAARYAAWGVKSATIRNELADLADLGFLRQPHTSSGRIPSDQGYRFYVDNLMHATPAETFVDRQSTIDSTLELESLLRHTCILLSRVTSYTSIATPPSAADTEVDRVLLTPVRDDRLLVAAVLSTGQVVNRRVGVPHDAASANESGAHRLTAADIDILSNAVNAWAAQKPLQQIGGARAPIAPMELTPRQRSAFTIIAHAVRQAVADVADEGQVVLQGATEIFKQPEFRDSGKSDGLLETLQRGAIMLQMLSSGQTQVTVVIGAENSVAAMHECSVVTAPYYVGLHLRGTIGVVGPTRMRYDRAIPAVNFFASTLSSTLTYLQA